MCSLKTISDIPFELKLLQIKNSFKHIDPEKNNSEIRNSFNELISYVFQLKQAGRMENVFKVLKNVQILYENNKNETKKTDNPSPHVRYLVLKSILTVLEQSKQSERPAFKLDWLKPLSNESQLSFSSIQLEKKIAEIMDVANNGNKLSLSGENNTPGMEDKKTSSQSSPKSLSKATGKMAKFLINEKRTHSFSSLTNLNTFQPPLKENSPIADLFIEKENIPPPESTKKELFFWELHENHLSNQILHPLVQQLQQESAAAFMKIKQELFLKDKESDDFDHCLCMMNRGIFVSINDDLTLFLTKSSHKISPDRFLAISYLYHQYRLSITIDRLYINNSVGKPSVQEKVQDQMNLYQFLLLYLDEFTSIDGFTNMRRQLCLLERAIAHDYETSKPGNRWKITHFKFDPIYRDYVNGILNAKEPFAEVGIVRRRSAQKLPPWLESRLKTTKN